MRCEISVFAAPNGRFHSATGATARPIVLINEDTVNRLKPPLLLAFCSCDQKEFIIVGVIPGLTGCTVSTFYLLCQISEVTYLAGSLLLLFSY